MKLKFIPGELPLCACDLNWLVGIHPTPRASLAMVPQFRECGIIDANGICVYTAIGICNAGFLSTHVGMMDGIEERSLISVAIGSHFIGGLCVSIFGHLLFVLLV